jgi:uncharacterized protein YeaO (DUF488 family)
LFAERYAGELAAPDVAELLDTLRASARKGPVTLLTSAKAPEESHAAVLARLLAE